MPEQQQKLAATKNINGVAFDGSSDITITAVADAGTLTGSVKFNFVVGSSSVSILTSLTVGINNRKCNLGEMQNNNKLAQKKT
jgi:energy-converting hydrogenase Eha subunit B